MLLQEAIVIILDIGQSVSQDTETIKSGFLENARQCVSMILKRKVRCIVIGESLVWILPTFKLGLKRLLGDSVEANHQCAMALRGHRTEGARSLKSTLWTVLDSIFCTSCNLLRGGSL